VEALIEGLLKGLGSLLAFFFSMIPSYGLAIILLTILVRVALFPLTYRQTRSMQAMQQLQPKLKELQRKHKGNRQKLNEEMMKLYKEHQVNPLGGCLPLLLQLPVFFALYAVLRGQIAHAAIPAEPLNSEALEQATCRPSSTPSPTGTVSEQIVCQLPGGEERTFSIEDWRTRDRSQPIVTPGAYMAHCTSADGGEGRQDFFLCTSPLGISHLPPDSDLRAEIIRGETPFLGMELGCSPTQALSQEEIQVCAKPGVRAGGFPLVGYFGLVALMVFTTYYQTKQMQKRAGPQAQQQGQQAMARIMPLFLGFISLSIPAGVLVYWVTSNGIQIGQQTLMLRSSQGPEPAPAGDGKARPTGKQPASSSEKSGTTGKRDGRPKGSANARGRKKRRKR
jgi:YidC/Oxa1 family membrane protein insertase